jgi:hypothetical protein
MIQVRDVTAIAPKQILIPLGNQLHPAQKDRVCMFSNSPFLQPPGQDCWFAVCSAVERIQLTAGRN